MRQDLINLAHSRHTPSDYRKTKMFNSFQNQVRLFTIQKHLKPQERNFLLKLFMNDDIQVLGSVEAYLHNSDA